MKKKLIAILVCTLFILSMVLSASGTVMIEKSTIPNLYDRGTLYVGGSGPGNYSSIQAAIDDANNGDTVFVYNGTYNEWITVDKSLDLIGEDRDITIIDGMGFQQVIYVSADFVNISGFSIIESGNYGIGIEVDSNFNRIFDNKLWEHGENCISLQWYSNNNTISGNIITQCDETGIELVESHDNIISENTITFNDYYGIFVQYSQRNTISDNIISNNVDGIYIAFYCNNNIISGNNFTSNWASSITLRSSDDNIVVGNNVSLTNNYGIYLLDATGCVIKENNVFENKYGIYVDNDANDNIIYHNNLINNTDYNGYDKSSNTWDDDYPSGGNYWDDFDEPGEGAWDNNSDGIVDSPYDIPGGSNQDRYPLIDPWGTNRKPNANFTYTPENPKRNENIQFNDTSTDDYNNIVSWWWDFDNGFYSDRQNPVYSYPSDGSYDVSLTVTDNFGAFDSTMETLVVLTNNPPSAPLINGPPLGNAGVEYEYHFLSVDPENDDLYYYIDWDDGNVEDWFGPFGSGEEVVVSHVWEEADIYSIKAKAKDVFDAESDWGYLPVEIPRNKITTNTLFMRSLDRFPNAFPILRQLLGL